MLLYACEKYVKSYSFTRPMNAYTTQSHVTMAYSKTFNGNTYVVNKTVTGKVLPK